MYCPCFFHLPPALHYFLIIVPPCNKLAVICNKNCPTFYYLPDFVIPLAPVVIQKSCPAYKSIEEVDFFDFVTCKKWNNQ